jgi:hypothetical protein
MARMGLHDALRRTRRRLVMAASPWKYRKGTVPLPIKWLISPLRYDVLVRLEFLRFHERHLDLYGTDFPAYLAKALDQPYFVWFREVLCRRRCPGLRDDRDGLVRAYEAKVRETAGLHRNYRERGFDRRDPIILRSGGKVLPTSTGKAIRRKMFVGDGCHRMALLMLDGAEILEPGHYRVRRYPAYEPLDNTHLLIGPLRLSRGEYYRYLSGGYTASTCEDRDMLLASVRKQEPARVAELEQVIAIDEPQFA